MGSGNSKLPALGIGRAGSRIRGGVNMASVTVVGNNGIVVELDENDTYNWAHRTGASWPCSTLSGHKVYAEFDSNGLLDLWINDGYAGNEDGSYPNGPDWVDGHEFSAMISDFVGEELDEDHPCWFVVAGQFR